MKIGQPSQVIAGLNPVRCAVNPQRYTITRCGLVFDTDPNARGLFREFTEYGKLLAQHTSYGYRTLVIRSEQGIHSGLRLHRLLALTFIGPAPFDGAVVRHLNDDRTDNRIENLAWGTTLENHRDMVRNGTAVYHFGEMNHGHKISLDDALEIKGLRASGMTLVKIADRFGISFVQVSRICNGKSWKHLSCIPRDTSSAIFLEVPAPSSGKLKDTPSQPGCWVA